MNKPLLTIGLAAACMAQAQVLTYDAATDGTIPPLGVSFLAAGSTDPLNPLSLKTANGFTGLGVTGGPASEEIDPDQSLTVTFATPQVVTKLRLAFLFNGPEFSDLNETAKITVTVDDLGPFECSLTARFDTAADYAVTLGAPGQVKNISPAIDPGGAGVWEISMPFGEVPVRSINLAGSVSPVQDPNSGTVINYSNDFSLHSFETVGATQVPGIAYDAARDGTIAPVGVAFVPSNYEDRFNPLSLKTVNSFTGLGVSGGLAGEEIDSDQSLTVKFANPQIVTRLTVAFLFDGPEFSDVNEQARISGGLLTADTATTATYATDISGAGPVINISPATDPGGAGVWEIRNPFGNTPVRSFTLAGSIRSVEDPESGTVIEYFNDFSLHSFETVAAGPKSRLCLPRAVNYFTGAPPSSVAIGDLNEDRKPDLVVAHYSGLLSVLFGNGDGTFQDPINLITTFPASAVALGYVNGDGHLDIVVTGTGSADSAILVFPGNGDGTFMGGQVSQGEPGAGGLALGDVDGDGHLDLVTTHRFQSLVSLQYGDGSGRFSLPRNYTFGGQPVFPVLRDLNGDGLLDLVFSRWQSDLVSVLFGGLGSFTLDTQDDYPVGDVGSPEPVAVGDFDGNGRLDLAIGFAGGQAGGSRVLIMLANAFGTFFQRNGTYSLDPGLFLSISTGDIDGDGKLDLVVSNSSESSVSVLLGRGDGSFELPVNAFVGAAFFSNPQSVAVADFNGDGKQDIVTANVTSAGISILLASVCNQTPVARCKRMVVSAGPDCAAIASVDDGSFDPDAGDTFTLTQSPAGPYSLGETIVTLTVTDNHGASASCNTIVSVADTTPPNPVCPGNLFADATSPQGAIVNYTVTASDNCAPPLTTICNPASGTLFPVGTTAVQCTATDPIGLQSQCSFSIHVKGPSEQIADLIAQINGLSINASTKTRMLTLLGTANQLLTSGNVKAACSSLKGLNDLIVALKQGKKISIADANALLAELALIRGAAGCP